ncbi:MAG TPA: DUF5694 domain-containing protein [Allosphingosinicella sp.]|jgi:hypothetical protein
MNKLALALVGAASVGLPSPLVRAQPFDPASFRTAVGEQHSEILVLGSPHLSETPGRIDPAWLDPLLASLGSFAPAAIVTETLPGEALHGLRAYQGIYPGVAEMFAAKRLRLASEAARRLGISMPAAEAEARSLVERWPKQPSPAERRRLAALFIAAGDLNSALVQWLRLPERERTARDGIGAEAAAQLGKMADSPNETVSIAVRLAVRLGLERLWSMDDQSESDLVFSALDAVTEAEQSPALAAARARRPAPTFTPMSSPAGVLAAFREHNGHEAGTRDAQHQWLARLEVAEHRSIHRRRVAGWEARNLRMAANIREISARYPGRRMLVVVGSAHKPYLEAYLRRMSDMRIVPASEVIGGRD